MAKLIGALGCNSARGKMGSLVYQTGNYGQYVKIHTPQRKKPSESQIHFNYLFGIASDKWRVLTDEEKVEWTVKARGKKMTGYNLFIKENFYLSSKIGSAIIGSDVIA